MMKHIKAIIALMKISIVFTGIVTILACPLVIVWIGSICLIDWIYR